MVADDLNERRGKNNTHPLTLRSASNLTLTVRVASLSDGLTSLLRLNASENDTAEMNRLEHS